MNRCGTCKSWELVGDLGRMGYGQCGSRTEPHLRAAVTTAAQTMCRIGKFVKAKPEELRKRENTEGVLL